MRKTRDAAKRLGIGIICLLILLASALGVHTLMHLNRTLNGRLTPDLEYESRLVKAVMNNERPVHPENWTEPAPAPLFYVPKPNFSQIFDGMWTRIPETNITINSVGIRDYEHPFDKPAGTFRIIIIGSSYTFGWGVDLNESYPKLLEKDLNDPPFRDDGSKFEVLNLGVPGYTALQQAEFLRQKGLQFHPDLVIIQFFIGDLEDMSRYYALREEIMDNRSEVANMDMEDSVKLNTYLHNKMHEEIMLSGLEAQWNATVDRAYAEIASLGAKEGFKALVFATTFDRETKALLETTTDKYGMPLAFTHINWQDEDMILNRIDTHPSVEAQQILEEEVLINLIRYGLLPKESG